MGGSLLAETTTAPASKGLREKRPRLFRKNDAGPDLAGQKQTPARDMLSRAGVLSLAEAKTAGYFSVPGRGVHLCL